MQRLITSVLAASLAPMLLTAGTAAWGYKCGVSDTPGDTSCVCNGSDDCNAMRHSGQCAEAVSCTGSGDSTRCTCAANRSVNPGNGGGGKNSGPRPPPNEAPPPTSARPPP
jgi:hypothetical protein